MKALLRNLKADKRFWTLLGIALFVAVIPPGNANSGNGNVSRMNDSVFFYRVNTVNYIKIQGLLIKKHLRLQDSVRHQ